MENVTPQPPPPSKLYRLFWSVFMLVGSYHFANRSTQDASKLIDTYMDWVGSKEHLWNSVRIALTWQHELKNHFEWFLVLISIIAILLWRLRSSLAVALTSVGVVIMMFVQGYISIMVGSSQMPELIKQAEKMQKTPPAASTNPRRP